MEMTEHKKQIEATMQNAWRAFSVYKKFPLKRRSALLRAIAVEIENLGDELLQVCMQESNLAEARLKGERARTIFQLNSYADACERGDWLEARIDTSDLKRTPPKPDLRKMLVPLGPVVVFGASNFPFAYSTAGGDTASALAAGCPVVVKGHPAHPKTSALVAEAIHKAIVKCGLPAGVFAHIPGSSNEVGKELVLHPYTKAVGFTGSYHGGKAIWEMANQRTEPIPVFAEMSSINPVYLFPEKLLLNAADLARSLAGSILLGAGQFCTNPGIIVAPAGAELETFTNTLADEIKKASPATMLHPGIAKNYRESRAKILQLAAVKIIAETGSPATEIQDIPTIASVTGAAFLSNAVLKTEVFGSFSLIVSCKDKEEMMAVAKNMEGQLTSTLMATVDDIKENEVMVEEIKNHCGRLIVNNVPTGVEVVMGMQHGGPWPSTTDSRFSSVGADAIKRFARPLSFQNWPDELLPDELKNNNPIGITRTVNNLPTKEPVVVSE
jgi:2,5-dioxopentanoate dehydrogenase